MSNANTIVDALRIAGIATEFAPSLTNPGGNNPWVFTQPVGQGVGAANPGAPIVLSVPAVQGQAVETGRQSGGAQSDSQLWYADKNSFLVRVVGRVQPNAFSKTLKLYLFTGNGITAGVNLVPDLQIGFASATLPAASSAFSNFYLEARCLWDSNSLQLNGVFSGMIGGVAIAPVGFSVNNPSAYAAQQAAGSYNPLQFIVAANIPSTVNPSNDVVYLDEFSAELL